MNIPKIVIIGGGYAGIEAAKKLAKHKKLCEITLIDKNTYHTLMTELHEIAGLRTERQSVQISFKRIFAGTAVNTVSDEVLGVDFKAQTITGKYGSYTYDYLVLATGGSPEFFGIEGVQEGSYTLWSLEDAFRIRDAFEIAFRVASAISNKEEQIKRLTFVIAGGGFTGVELVGELAERAAILCDRYHIDRMLVGIHLVEAKSEILPILPESLRIKAKKRLEKLGVHIHCGKAISSVKNKIIHFANEESIYSPVLVWTCGIQGGEFTSKINLEKGSVSNNQCSIATKEGIHGLAGCAFDEDEEHIVGQRGRFLVNENLQAIEHKNVYIGGDILWYLHQEKVVPQIVETAVQSGKTIAKNIIAQISAKVQSKFEPRYHGFMVSIGSRYAVAHGLGLKLSGFTAMLGKHLVNMLHLFSLAGFNAVFGYVKEEFIDIRNNRSIFGSHISSKSSSFWLVLLRLWLGFTWLAEGINKIGEGWLVFNKSATSSMFSENISQGKITIDAVTSASLLEEKAAVAVPSLNFDSTILNQKEGLGQWFQKNILDTLVAPIPFEVLQVGIVFGELGIGLAILGGLFTFPAALASILLCIMLVLSSMLKWSMLWMLVAAIAIMGGAGRSFGLDSYALPWLGKWWRKTRLAQRTYLYTGEPEKKVRKKGNKNA